MFQLLGRLAVNHPRRLCAGWLALAVGLTLVAPDWRNQSQDDDIRFLPASYPSVRGFHLLEKAFPQDVFASRALFALERDGTPLTGADFALVDRLSSEIQKLAAEEPALQINGLCSCRDGLVGGRLVSADRQ